MRLSSILLFFVLITLSRVASAEENFTDLGEQGIQAFQNGDFVTAMGLLEKSANGGYAPAQATLAYLLDKSDFDDKAYYWYEQAAQQGDADGEYGLARLFANGEGVEKDPAAALGWLLKAVEQKHRKAESMYANALEVGILGLEKNAKKALGFYQKCHDSGEYSCTMRLIRANNNGELGLPVDAKKAKELYTQINQPKDSDK